MHAALQYFLSLPSTLRWATVLLLGMVGFLVWDQSYWWNSREDYMFGFIVPFFVAYVLFDRWPRLNAILSEGGSDTPAPSPWWEPLAALFFGALLLGGLLLYTLGGMTRAAEGSATTATMPLSFGFGFTLLGMAFFMVDRDRGGRPIAVGTRLRLVSCLIFPAFIWVLSAPLFSVVEKMITTALLNKVMIIVFTTFDLLALPLERQGSILILPNQDYVGVEDACSGIRSLTACLFAGSFLAAVYLNRFWKKVLMVACAMVLAFVGNIFRSLFLTAWAYAYGSQAIDGKVHDITGYAVLGFTMVGLLILLPIFNFRLEDDLPPSTSAPPAA